MSDDPACEHAAAGTCSQECTSAAPGPIDLADAVARFDREVVRGTLDTGRYRMARYSWGNGPPLIGVHGVADTSRSFLLPYSRLSSSFRCIAYDLPTGHGDGARQGRYTLDGLVADLVALMDAEGLSRAYLLGSSFGSLVAQRALRLHPNRFPRAILQGGTAYRPLRFVERSLAWWMRFFPGRMGGLKKRERILSKLHGRAFEGLPQERWKAFVEWTASAPISAVAHHVRMLHRLDLRPELPEIRQPVLLVHGDIDATMPRPHADALMAGLVSPGMAVIEGCGHVPAYSHPEAFAEVIRRFLTPTPPGCPGERNPADACSAHPTRVALN